MSLRRLFKPGVHIWLLLAGVLLISMLTFLMEKKIPVRRYAAETIQHSHQDQHNNTKNGDVHIESEFAKVLREHADDRGYIILVSVDFGYIDMALNFYESSLKKLSLRNYLFVTSDQRASKALDQYNISNFNYFNDKEGGLSSNYATSAFARKTHYKTKIILDALQLNFTVLISDVDIILLKDPFRFMRCTTCDLQITNDSGSVNSGFYLARPTAPAIKLHQQAWEDSLRNPKKSNQKHLNELIKKMVRKKYLSSTTLGLDLFPCGLTYFEKGHRMFAGDNPCSSCVIIHDNWIVGNAAKIYRFKEHLMWHVDSGGYYSDPLRKYLVYDNPLDFGNKSKSYEEQALKTALALGHLLNRTVILPTFDCSGCGSEACKSPSKKCALNVHYRLSHFDNAFQGLYREHVFLRHEKVPEVVKQSQSELILIENKLTATKLETEVRGDLFLFKPANTSTGASVREVLRWFGTEEYSNIPVLRFHSLYNSFSGLMGPEYDAFKTKLKSGLSSANYRQY